MTRIEARVCKVPEKKVTSSYLCYYKFIYLLFVYGPPAVGKLTISRELAELTGYRLFHNHLTVLVVHALFPNSGELPPDPRRSVLLKKIRLDCITAAVEADTNIIFTLAYSGAIDDPFVDTIVKSVRKHGGHVHFVQLTAPEKVLLHRVDSQSRKSGNKLTSLKQLRQVLAAHDMRACVTQPNVLKLDTSEVTPKQAAKRVIKYFRLLPDAER